MADFTPIETQEQFDAMVKDRVERAKRTAAKEFEERLKESDGMRDQLEHSKTELESLKTKIKELETAKADGEKMAAELTANLAKEKASAVKMRAAIEAGLPVEFADRLSGDDEEAIKADAATMAKFMGAKHPTAPMFNNEEAPKDPKKAGYLEMVRSVRKE